MLLAHLPMEWQNRAIILSILMASCVVVFVLGSNSNEMNSNICMHFTFREKRHKRQRKDDNMLINDITVPL